MNIQPDIIAEAKSLYDQGKKKECFLILNPILEEMQENGESASGEFQELLERIILDETLVHGVKS